MARSNRAELLSPKRRGRERRVSPTTLVGPLLAMLARRFSGLEFELSGVAGIRGASGPYPVLDTVAVLSDVRIAERAEAAGHWFAIAACGVGAVRHGGGSLIGQ